MDEVEHSWELRAPRGDRNKFRSTLRWMRARLCDTADLDEGQRLNLMDEVEHSWELRAPRGDRNKFRSTLRWRGRLLPLEGSTLPDRFNG